MPVIQPITDFKLSFTPDVATGSIIVDLVLSPTGDLALASGIDRLVQMIVLWLLTPQGANPFDPTYGNPYYAALGRPSSSSADYLDMLTACEQAFLSTQDQAAQAGQLSMDEMVDHFADNSVSIPGPGQVVISFTIVARSGVSQGLLLPFAAVLASGQLPS